MQKDAKDTGRVNRALAFLLLTMLAVSLMLPDGSAAGPVVKSLEASPDGFEHGDRVYFDATLDRQAGNITFIYCTNDVCYLPKYMSYNNSEGTNHFYMLSINSLKMQRSAEFGVRLEIEDAGSTTYYPSKDTYEAFYFSNVPREPDYRWIYGAIVGGLLVGSFVYNKAYCRNNDDEKVCEAPDKKKKI